MEFVFETEYDGKAMTEMARVLRKTLRRENSCRAHIFGVVVLILGALLSIHYFLKGSAPDFIQILTWFAMALILIVLVFEDRINGYAARKMMMPGTEKARAVFREDGFISETNVGVSEWKYDKVQVAAETEDFFVFVFSASYGQCYDKRKLKGGTVDEFREFIERKMGRGVWEV